jgi:hypothetical protein
MSNQSGASHRARVRQHSRYCVIENKVVSNNISSSKSKLMEFGDMII